VGPRAGLDAVKKRESLATAGNITPAVQALPQLSYPGSLYIPYSYTEVSYIYLPTFTFEADIYSNIIYSPDYISLNTSNSRQIKLRINIFIIMFYRLFCLWCYNIFG
jgi:hypothetical protein